MVTVDKRQRREDEHRKPNSYNGKHGFHETTLRLTDAMRDKLDALATRHHRSINAEMTMALEHWIRYSAGVDE